MHAEGLPDPGDLDADLAKPDDAEVPAVQIDADRALPWPVLPHLRVLKRDLPRQAKDEAPGQFCWWRRTAAGATHHDIACRRKIDGSVAHAARDEQAEPWQPLEQACRKRGSLPHDDNDIGIGESIHEGVFVSDVLAQARDRDAVSESVPVGIFQGNTLVVIQNDAILHGGPPTKLSVVRLTPTKPRRRGEPARPLTSTPGHIERSGPPQ